MSTEPTSSAARANAGAATPKTTPKTSAKIVPSSGQSMGELRAEAQLARDELASTLAALEYKADVPQRLNDARQELTRRLRRLGDENPAALLGIAAGAAAVAGTVAWLVARAVIKR